MTYRSPRKLPITASNNRISRRRLLAGALLAPGLAVRPPGRPPWLRPEPGQAADSAAAAGATGPAAGVASSTSTLAAPATDPYVVVLGTAQDAGAAQVNCFTDNCEAVRTGRRPKPRVASLGLVDPVEGKRFIFDATPDFAAQVGDLIVHPPGGDRPSGSLRLEEHLHGIFLTHGHMGHYTGLIHCGREGAASRELPVYASRRMIDYLQANEPWAFLFRNGHLSAAPAPAAAPIELTSSLAVTPFSVVHRQEFTDTVGFLIEGPARSLIYVPDADRWADWPVPFEDWLDRADVALLDGSFFSHDELGHRPQGEVPHPPVADTLQLLERRGDDTEVWFIHLNNTNPLWDPLSPQRTIVVEAGAGVAETGQVLPL